MIPRPATVGVSRATTVPIGPRDAGPPPGTRSRGREVETESGGACADSCPAEASVGPDPMVPIGDRDHRVRAASGTRFPCGSGESPGTHTSRSAPDKFSASTPSAASSSPRERKLQERIGDERGGQAPTAPRPADGDVLQPPSTDTEPRVLLGEDHAHDRSRHLVAIPGDPPHRGIDARHREPADEVFLGPLARLPMIAEGFRVGVPDPPMVGLDDRPDLEALRAAGHRELGQTRVRTIMKPYRTCL